jgi:hypothetical protein
MLATKIPTKNTLIQILFEATLNIPLRRFYYRVPYLSKE